MACGGSQGSPAQKDEQLISVSSCWNPGEEFSPSQRKALNNGQVLLVLNAHEACFSPSFDTNLWEERLKTLGIQVTADQWKNLLHSTVLQPDVRRYLFYNSRGFGITIAAVLYVTLWINLYSTLMIFSVAPSWEVSILVTMIALLVALVVQLIIDQHQRKLNPNTDMRLSAANEVFMKHDFLVGITDRQHKVHSIPQLWFVHFSMGPCLQFLGNTVAQMRREQASTLKRKQERLCISVEISILPGLEKKPSSSLEESPLLPERKDDNRATLTRWETLPLLPEASPEEMAQQLLTIFGSYYVRLLAQGQLSEVPVGRHIDLGHLPCLCQFIESKMLAKTL